MEQTISNVSKTLYGMTGEGLGVYRSAGARFLMARRLVEAGARFVTVSFGARDTHAHHDRSIEPRMPDLDRAYAGLITDLDRRGMLDSTLVIINSACGRTPKINAGGRRDHWPRAYSVIMAGGGIKRGQVFGASDALAAEPARDPLSVEDHAHTVYRMCGDRWFITPIALHIRCGAAVSSLKNPRRGRLRCGWGLTNAIRAI